MAEVSVLAIVLAILLAIALAILLAEVEALASAWGAEVKALTSALDSTEVEALASALDRGAEVESESDSSACERSKLLVLTCQQSPGLQSCAAIRDALHGQEVQSTVDWQNTISTDSAGLVVPTYKLVSLDSYMIVWSLAHDVHASMRAGMQRTLAISHHQTATG